MSTNVFVPHCGDFEHVVFSARVHDTHEALCICPEPGQHYGFHFGASGQPPKVSFSVADHSVRGDFDWQRIDGVDWAYVSLSHEGVAYTAWVSRPETENALPRGLLQIRGKTEIDLVLVPASIIHDLPFA